MPTLGLETQPFATIPMWKSSPTAGLPVQRRQEGPADLATHLGLQLPVQLVGQQPQQSCLGPQIPTA